MTRNPTFKEFVRATFQYNNDKDEPANIDGLPVVTTSDESIGIAKNVVDTGEKGKFTAELWGVTAGAIHFSAKADGKPGEGERVLVLDGDLTYDPIADEGATKGTVTLGEPELQVPVEPMPAAMRRR